MLHGYSTTVRCLVDAVEKAGAEQFREVFMGRFTPD
jgi:hypothetical protein